MPREVAPGLWIGQVDHPDRHPEADWPPAVASTVVAS